MRAVAGCDDGDAVVGEQLERRRTGPAATASPPALPALLVDPHRGSRRRAVASRARWPSAASPLRVPSSTGMPLSRSRCAVTGSIADGTEASTASGASGVRRRRRGRRRRRRCHRRTRCTRSTASAVTATAGIVDDRPQARAEQGAGVRAGAPHVERVGGDQSLVEQLAEGGQRARRPGRRTSTPRSWARSAHSARSAPESCTVAIPSGAGGRRRPAAKSSRVSVNSARSVTRTAPVAAQNAVPPGGVAGQRAGVRGHHRPPAGRAADGQDHHRYVALGRAAQRRPQPGPDRGRLQQQRDERGLRVVERVLDVVGGVGDQFLAGGHREPEAEPAAGCAAGSRTPSRSA